MDEANNICPMFIYFHAHFHKFYLLVEFFFFTNLILLIDKMGKEIKEKVSSFVLFKGKRRTEKNGKTDCTIKYECVFILFCKNKKKLRKKFKKTMCELNGSSIEIKNKANNKNIISGKLKEVYL